MSDYSETTTLCLIMFPCLSQISRFRSQGSLHTQHWTKRCTNAHVSLVTHFQLVIYLVHHSPTCVHLLNIFANLIMCPGTNNRIMYHFTTPNNVFHRFFSSKQAQKSQQFLPGLEYKQARINTVVFMLWKIIKLLPFCFDT